MITWLSKLSVDSQASGYGFEWAKKLTELSFTGELFKLAHLFLIYLLINSPKPLFKMKIIRPFKLCITLHVHSNR